MEDNLVQLCEDTIQLLLLLRLNGLINEDEFKIQLEKKLLFIGDIKQKY